ncbi:MAG: DUF3137 domain-containing protein [Verrucomicrobiota bacterium]
MSDTQITNAEQWIQEGISELEVRRRRWLSWFLAAWGTTVGIVAISYCLFQGTSLDDRVWLAWAAVSVIGLVILFSMAGGKGSDFRRQFDCWRERVIRGIDDQAEFSPTGCVAQDVFDSSCLNKGYYNKYAGDSHLAIGNIQASNLSVKHVYQETYYETVTETDGQGRTTSRQVARTRTVVVPVYDGLFLLIPARLAHSGAVLLRHREAGIPKEMKSLRVADPHLNKHYAIGASDSFVGHRAMTPTLMEALWDFGLQFKNRPGYSYRDDQLFIAIPNFRISYGQSPGKWTGVTTGKLRKIIDSCESSIHFLKATAERLQPT